MTDLYARSLHVRSKRFDGCELRIGRSVEKIRHTSPPTRSDSTNSGCEVRPAYRISSGVNCKQRFVGTPRADNLAVPCFGTRSPSIKRDFRPFISMEMARPPGAFASTV